MAADDITPQIILDTRGMFCPAPIIKLSQALGNIDVGAIVELVSDDPAIEFDAPAWCRSTGHEIVAQSRSGRDYVYRVKKSGEQPGSKGGGR